MATGCVGCAAAGDAVVAASLRGVVVLSLLLVVVAWVALSAFGLRTGLLVNWRGARTLSDRELAPPPVTRGDEGKPDARGLAALAKFRVLSDEDAARAAALVLEDRRLWRARGGGRTLYTLGASAYLDGGSSAEPAQRTRYAAKAAAENARMTERYGWVADAVLDAFRARLPPGAGVRLRQGAAVPGIHIFRADRLFSMPVASVHRDGQHRALTPRPGEVRAKETLSFTLALALPAAGGGLNVVDEGSLPTGGLWALAPNVLRVRAARLLHIPYTPGFGVTHDGNHLHAIAPSPWAGPGTDEMRITMQCHGVLDLATNEWEVYW